MPDSTLFNFLLSVMNSSKAEQDAALVAVTANLRSLSSLDTARQLMYRGGLGMGVLHLLAFFRECEQAASLLSLVIERGRESCGTTALMNLTSNNGATPLHSFAGYCSDLSLTKMVLREHPPSLTVLNNLGRNPLIIAELNYGSTPENAVFFRAASAAFNASKLTTLVTLCDGSSPYLAREILGQETSLRAAVAICLNRQEEAPSALDSVEADVALSLLERLRDFGRVGNSSDLLRVVLSFVGP